MKNEKTIKLDFITNSEKVENRTSKEAGRMKNLIMIRTNNYLHQTLFWKAKLDKLI